MSEKKFFIGVDIGGTHCSFGIVSPNGEIFYQQTWSTQDFDTPTHLAQKIIDEIHSINTYSLVNCQGVGIGAPSANTHTGCIHHAANLPWKGVVDIQNQFETAFNLPVALANDANATACGEAIFGGAKNLNNFAVVTIGTGLGAGIIVNGKIIEGFDGNGGELGHMLLYPDGRKCGCGRNGCLETYTSASGMVYTAKELASEYATPSNLAKWILNGNNISGKTIFNFLQEQDILAAEVFKRTGYRLGIGIANMVTLLGLEQIFLFGGPVAAGDCLLNPIKESFNKHVIFFYQGKTIIQPSLLPNRDASILGAASLVQFTNRLD